jgi:hypothetical protein
MRPTKILSVNYKMDFRRLPIEALCPRRQLDPTRLPSLSTTEPEFSRNSAAFQKLAPSVEAWYPDRKRTTQQEFMFNALRESPMELHYAFFSRANINYIHSELTRRVQQQTNLIIDKQSDETLSVIMKYLFEENAQFNPDDVQGQVQTLNEIVLKTIVPMAVVRVKTHLAYLKDITTLPQPLERAAATSVTGTLSHEFTTYF